MISPLIMTAVESCYLLAYIMIGMACLSFIIQDFDTAKGSAYIAIVCVGLIWCTHLISSLSVEIPMRDVTPTSKRGATVS